VDAVGKTMENEKPHQNVDSRKPIRKENGERTGKVTDYKVSELRAMNIMETLCGGVTRPTDVKWVMGPIGPRSPKSSILKLVDTLGACPFQFLRACLPQKPAAATVVVPYTAFHIAAPGRHIGFLKSFVDVLFLPSVPALSVFVNTVFLFLLNHFQSPRPVARTPLSRCSSTVTRCWRCTRTSWWKPSAAALRETP
jgi:hypothetical protein